jgi:hypothetical protein
VHLFQWHWNAEIHHGSAPNTPCSASTSGLFMTKKDFKDMSLHCVWQGSWSVTEFIVCGRGHGQ